jgi:hypothetical protein
MKTGESLISGKLVSRIVMGLVMAGTCIRAGAAEPKIPICLDKGIDPAVVSQAQAIAGRMFSRIDVGIRWYGYHGSCPVRDDKPIMIQMSSHTAEKHFARSFGQSAAF